MEYEIESTIAPVYGVTSLLTDAISKKYDSINDLNSIKINAADENFDDINPVIDSIIEDENNHIGKLQQLIDLMNDSEDLIEEGKAETIDLIDNPEIMESMTMAKKLRLNENFDNVIDDVQAVADPVFVGANKEHDENKKNYEKAMKENEKEAKETIPKEGDTGKKVTSKELKKMKLSESAWEDRYNSELNPDLAQSCADDVCEYMLTEFVDLSNTQIRQVLNLAIEHFKGPDFEESLQEGIQRYSDVVPKEDRKYWYFTTHGVGPGSIPKDLNVLDVKEGQNDKGTWGDYVCLDGVLNTSELKKFDMIEKAPMRESYRLDKDGFILDSGKKIGKLTSNGFKLDDPEAYEDELDLIKKDIQKEKEWQASMNESLQYKIAKEQIQRFSEGKMPKNWTVDKYLTRLTEKKHITQKEAKSLKEWYNGSKQTR